MPAKCSASRPLSRGCGQLDAAARCREVSRSAADRGRRSDRQPQRGLHTARPRAVAVRPARGRGAAQARGRQPDRQLQGPRDDARGGAVIVPEGKIAIGKLAQALMHGARVIALRGNFDQALEIVRALAASHPVELVNSVNPYRIEGQKTGAFEVCDELDVAPEALAIPVGNAGNITAWWRGFQELGEAPILYGFQAAGAAPLVAGHPIDSPETVASAIRIGNPARWEEAMAAVTGSRGRIAAVSHEQIP